MAELEYDLFSAGKSVASKVSDGLYGIIVKLLIAIMICLLAAAGLGILYRINLSKIEDFRSRIRTAFDSDEKTTDNTISKLHDIDEDDDKGVITEKKKNREESINTNNETEEEKPTLESRNTETESLVSDQNKEENAQSNEATASESEVEMSDADKEKMSYSIMVVRDGVITGRESIKTGEILDRYSDSAGTWSGYIDPDTGEVFVYYSGVKNGEKFAIEFSVYSDDTFKVTAAGKNGEKISNYSEFFQEILTSEGL